MRWELGIGVKRQRGAISLGFFLRGAGGGKKSIHRKGDLAIKPEESSKTQPQEGEAWGTGARTRRNNIDWRKTSERGKL